MFLLRCVCVCVGSCVRVSREVQGDIITTYFNPLCQGPPDWGFGYIRNLSRRVSEGAHLHPMRSARLFIYHREQLEAKEAESEILVQPAEDSLSTWVFVVSMYVRLSVCVCVHAWCAVYACVCVCDPRSQSPNPKNPQPS